MRRVVMMSVALLGVSTGPLLAQPATPGGSTAAMPGTAGPGSTGTVPGTGAMPDTGSGNAMTGLRPMRGQTRQAVGMHHPIPHAAPSSTRVGTTRQGGRTAPASVAQDEGVAVPPTADYRGGAGSPSSNTASNITAGDTRSEIAPRLPNPDAGGNSPRAYLVAAQRALASNRTGAAQEALERAETRLLTRATDPSMANMPDSSSSVQAIGAARRALAARDTASARSAISAAMSGLGS